MTEEEKDLFLKRMAVVLGEQGLDQTVYGTVAGFTEDDI